MFALHHNFVSVIFAVLLLDLMFVTCIHVCLCELLSHKKRSMVISEFFVSIFFDLDWGIPHFLKADFRVTLDKFSMLEPVT